MIQIPRHTLIKLAYIFIDIVFLALAIYLACLLRPMTLMFPVTFHNLFFNSDNPFAFVFHFWIFITLFFNNTFKLYQTRREFGETLEIWQLVKSIALSTLLTIVLIYLAKIEDFPRSILVLVAVFNLVLFSSWRICKRYFVEYLVSQGYNNFNAIIIGAGKVGVALAHEI